MNRLEREYEGKVEFRIMNFDHVPEAEDEARRFGVQFIPTFIFIDSQGNTIEQRVGAIPEDEFRDLLDSLD